MNHNLPRRLYVSSVCIFCLSSRIYFTLRKIIQTTSRVYLSHYQSSCCFKFPSPPIVQQPPGGSRPPHSRGFTITLRQKHHTQTETSHSDRNITLVWTSLHECSTRHRDLCLTKHTTHKRRLSMPPARFEPEIPTSERPQTHTLDRAATGIGLCFRFGNVLQVDELMNFC